MLKFADREISYDYLIVAAGASHAYFGHDEWEPFAPGLKTIEDALEIRRRVLLAFELAERHAASSGEQIQLNFVIVGGGPTGVELAGTLSEIAHRALPEEFNSIDTRSARIILLEGGPRILPAYPEDLSRSAEQQLRGLGVEVHTSTMVTGIEPAAVHMGATRLPAAVILWAAGVAASPLGKKLGAPVDRAGRVLVNADLSLPGHPEVFVIGDLAALKDKNGQLVPGVAPGCNPAGKGDGPKYCERPARKTTARFSLRQQRQSRNHWPRCRDCGVWQNSYLRIHRLAVMAIRPRLFPDRISQPHIGDDSVGMVVLHLRTRSPIDYGRSNFAKLARTDAAAKQLPTGARQRQNNSGLNLPDGRASMLVWRRRKVADCRLSYLWDASATTSREGCADFMAAEMLFDSGCPNTSGCK